jgi:hypothetical protein
MRGSIARRLKYDGFCASFECTWKENVLVSEEKRGVQSGSGSEAAAWLRVAKANAEPPLGGKANTKST